MKANLTYCKIFYMLLILWTAMACKDKEPGAQYQNPVRTYKLAMVQMEVNPGKPGVNLDRAAERVTRAAANGASMALLPEAMDLGWTDPSAHTQACEIPAGKTCRRLCRVARENGIFICAGIVEKDGEKTYNSAVIIDPAGQVILTHRKINELDIAHDVYAQGDRLGVVHTSIGTLGLFICADANAFNQCLSNSLGYMGADIILSPSAWAVKPGYDNKATPYAEPWRSLYRATSSRFDLWMIGVSNVGKIEAGPWKDWSCIGSSLAFAPGGREVLQAPFGVEADTITYVDIELNDRPARGTGWQKFWESHLPDAQ